jgi:hypothetical protein
MLRSFSLLAYPGRLLPYPKTLDWAGKACTGKKHSSLLQKSINYGRKSFIGLAPVLLFVKLHTNVV